MSEYSGNQLNFDMESRHMIEALRSGIPSRSVGQYFTEARPKIMNSLTGKMDEAVAGNNVEGMIITGKYGEGKTHLLNTAFCLAEQRNMVVSFVSLSKETPVDKVHILYPKIISNTFLPGHRQPGFSRILEQMTQNSPVATEMIAYCAKHLETDKLYYLLRSYLGTEDADEKFLLQADLEGDFIANSVLKNTYKRIYNQPVKFNVNFAKTKHTWDYFKFMNHLFITQGYSGWIILFDECELIGRFSKKARLNAYYNMDRFLHPVQELGSFMSVLAFSASYVEDVIDGKQEFDNLSQIHPGEEEPAKSVLDQIMGAPQLVPLNKEELHEIIGKILDFHARAYNWQPSVSIEELSAAALRGGYLLRTRIRAVIECLDQQYQYNNIGENEISRLSEMDYEEDIVILDEFG